MTDLDERFRSLTRTPAPDLWPEIDRREATGPTGPTFSRRLLVGAVAFAISMAGVGVAVWALRPDERAAQPVGTVSNGAIAFTSGDGGSYHIATVTLDGTISGLTQPSRSEYDLGPAWSSDGRSLAFLRYTEQPRSGEVGDAYDYELFVVGSDGRALVDLDQPASGFSWSMDGSAIAYSSFQKGSDYDLLLVGSRGSGPRPLVTTPLTDVEPSWSPTTDAVAFVSHPVLDRDPGDADIYSVRTDGTQLTRLTGSPEWDYAPAWSPNGSRIAYLSERVDEREVYVMNADGSGKTVVTEAPTNDVTEPVWSPDGTKIAFGVFSGTSWDIYVVNADGTGQTALADGPLDEVGAEWSPDGTMVAYSAAESSESCRCDNAGSFDVYVVRPDGTDTRRLTTGAQELGGDLSWQAVLEAQQPSPSSSPATEHESLPPAAPEITASISVGPTGNTNAILYAEGSVWVAASFVEGGGGVDDAMLFRIDAKTNEIVARIPLEGVSGFVSGGGGLAYGFGSVWVAGYGHVDGSTQAVTHRIDPMDNVVTAMIPLGGTHGADVAVDQSNVWVAYFGEEHAAVARIDPETDSVTARLPLRSDYVRRISAADVGVVATELEWQGNEGPCTVLTAIDPTTATISARERVQPPCGGVELFAWNDEIWASGSALQRVDPMTAQLVGDAIPFEPEHFPRSFVFGTGREVWFAAYPGGNGVRPDRVARLDAGTGDIEYFIEAGGTDAAFSAETRTIWILEYEGSLTRVDLDDR